MRHQHPRLSGKGTSQNAVVKKMMSHMRVNCRERVIEQDDVCVGIGGAGDAKALSLSTRQGDAALTDLGSTCFSK
jgi:hypothetical protein